MIPFDSSVTAYRDIDLQPELLWQQALISHAMGRPPNNQVAAPADTHPGPREDGHDCCARDHSQPRPDAYYPTSTEHSAMPATYSKEEILAQHAALQSSGMLIPRAPEAEAPEALTSGEKEELQELQKRDREVRQHEMTHKAMLGTDAGAITYTYQIGPDGRPYAIGGSVEVNTAKATTPEASIAKAQRLRMAALAVGDPSAADMSVALEADQMRNDSLRQYFTAE